MNYHTNQADQTNQNQPYFYYDFTPPPLPPLPPDYPPQPSHSPILTNTPLLDPSLPEKSVEDDNDRKLQPDKSDTKGKKKKGKERERGEEGEDEREKKEGREGGKEGEIDNTNKLSQTQKMLQQLLKDPLLSDLAKLNSEGNISLEEVDTLIALETGTAFKIKIERDGLEPFCKCDKFTCSVFFLSLFFGHNSY